MTPVGARGTSGGWSRAHVVRVAMVLLTLTACRAPWHSAPKPSPRPPDALLGAFEDDYGERHQISADLWQHGTATRYRLLVWSPDSAYVLARNARSNPSAGSKWSRIDWVRLTEMAPFEWAFCLSAYEASTKEAALAAPQANRATPRTGCNGFPFTRMKRAP